MKQTIMRVMLASLALILVSKGVLADSEFDHSQPPDSDGAWGWKPEESDGNDGAAPDGGSSLFDGPNGSGGLGAAGGASMFGSQMGSALMNAGVLTLITSMLQSAGGQTDNSASTEKPQQQQQQLPYDKNRQEQQEQERAKQLQFGMKHTSDLQSRS